MSSGADKAVKNLLKYAYQGSFNILDWINSQITKDVPSVIELRRQLNLFIQERPEALMNYDSNVVNELIAAILDMLDAPEESLENLHWEFRSATQYTLRVPSMFVGWLGFNPNAKLELPTLIDYIMDGVENSKYALEAIKRIGGLELPFVIATIKEQLNSKRSFSFGESILLAVDLGFQDSDELFEIINTVSQGGDEEKRYNVTNFLFFSARSISKPRYRPILDRLLNDSSENVKLEAQKAAWLWDS